MKNDFRILISLDGNRYANSYRKFHNGKESFNKVIKKYNIDNYRFKPIYNNKNIDFFKNSVYLDSCDFAGTTTKRKDIFANRTLNRNSYGNLYVLPDKSIKTSVFDKKTIGRIDQNFVSILINA
ncbi:MAG: hypothetical protein JXR69_10640 [Candidatus Delongbacteria bacterium]|nr:hypothetical protein [Candidatus Delongbacteria bacterium]